MPSKHARLSPSAASRWINCPGSISLADKVPAPPAGSYAEEGTVAHSLAELKLRKQIGDLTSRKFNSELSKLKCSEFFNAEMDQATSDYADAVMERLAAAGPDAELMVEQQFRLDDWVPDGFGTSDAVVIGGGVIEVIDLKYGKGVKVEAPGNPQLRLYGLGAAGLFGDLYDFSTVRETIIQPRLDHISTEEIPLVDLMEWAETIVKPAAQAASSGSEETACGDWCRFCPAKAVCRKRAEANLALAKMEFADPPLLSNEEISEVLKQADELKRWVTDVTEYALGAALGGGHFEGWKLVEGRSIRKYSDDKKVVDALVAAGYEEAMLFERKLYGISAMEKLVGKKKLTEVLGDLITKPAGKPTLVPESDKRKPYNPAAADFEKE